jgi:hypothetical protein
LDLHGPARFFDGLGTIKKNRLSNSGARSSPSGQACSLRDRLVTKPTSRFTGEKKRPGAAVGKAKNDPIGALIQTGSQMALNRLSSASSW